VSSKVLDASFKKFKEIFVSKMSLWMPFALMEAITACVAFSYTMKCTSDSLSIPPTSTYCVDASILLGSIAKVMSGAADISSHPAPSEVETTGNYVWEGSNLTVLGGTDSKNIYVPAPISLPPPSAASPSLNFSSNGHNSPHSEATSDVEFSLIEQRALFLSSQIQLSTYKSTSFFRYLWIPLIASVVAICYDQLDTAFTSESMYVFFFCYL
jgi:hypothetical protein